jgi:pimeloyl-ACP methyl ester carboxylesterase
MSKTIVMIHGMWVAGWCWDLWRDFFQHRGYTCLAPTLRHHDVEPGALADPDLGRTGLLDYAQDLESFIWDLPEPPVIMGHSMGGLLAQMLAGRGLGSALVLLCPAAPAGINSISPAALKTFGRLMMTWGFWRKPHRITYQAAAWAILNRVAQEQRRPLYNRYVFESGRAAAQMGFWWLDAERASRVDETRVTAPVLVVAGGQDRITPAATARRVAAKYRGDYREFPENAHYVLGEPGWEAIADCVSGWLKAKMVAA